MDQARIKKWVDRIVEEISVNAARVNQEIRETGELAVLLGKAARGQRLTEEERGKVREQLVDLAKIVPSLAILAAPGGTLILAALLKVLPINLLPSAFHGRPGTAGGEPEGVAGPEPREAVRGGAEEGSGTAEIRAVGAVGEPVSPAGAAPDEGKAGPASGTRSRKAGGA